MVDNNVERKQRGVMGGWTGFLDHPGTAAMEKRNPVREVSVNAGDVWKTDVSAGCWNAVLDRRLAAGVDPA
jgi:hypothetical protein